jgi:hypothetical protein
MIVSPADSWKLVLAVALGVTIFAGACGAAPRRAVPHSDLRRLVLSALGLYVVGGVATISHHTTVAALVYAAGIAVCTLALWLSRGTDSGDDPPRGGDEPSDEQPPPSPDGLPEFDWAAFEEEFRSHAQSVSERHERVGG